MCSYILMEKSVGPNYLRKYPLFLLPVCLSLFRLRQIQYVCLDCCVKGKKRAGKMQLLHECTNQHALKIDSSATKRKILQQQQVSYPSSCFAIHNWSQTLYKVVFESQYTLKPVYHCHKPVFRPKMAIFRRAGMKEGGLPLPLAFQYLIFMI